MKVFSNHRVRLVTMLSLRACQNEPRYVTPRRECAVGGSWRANRPANRTDDQSVSRCAAAAADSTRSIVVVLVEATLPFTALALRGLCSVARFLAVDAREPLRASVRQSAVPLFAVPSAKKITL